MYSNGHVECLPPIRHHHCGKNVECCYSYNRRSRPISLYWIRWNQLTICRILYFSYLELVSFEMFFPFVPASARLTCVFGTLLFNRPLIQLLYSFPRGCCSFDRSSFHPCSVLIRILICPRNRITMMLGISLVFNKGIDKMWGMLHRFVGAIDIEGVQVRVLAHRV
jgi:hypothetical protein